MGLPTDSSPENGMRCITTYPTKCMFRPAAALPAHGWRTDDHTGFVRQGQMIFGQPFDHERRVTGLEFGMNPNIPTCTSRVQSSR